MRDTRVVDVQYVARALSLSLSPYSLLKQNFQNYCFLLYAPADPILLEY